ncbi:MAG: hypothetical protein ACXWUF_20330 [Methylomagnum sp.]
MELQTGTLVEILPTRVWAEKDIMGTTHIKMQHQGGTEPFDFVQIQYDWRYTSNSHQADLAKRILELLGAKEAA